MLSICGVYSPESRKESQLFGHFDISRVCIIAENLLVISMRKWVGDLLNAD